MSKTKKVAELNKHKLNEKFLTILDDADKVEGSWHKPWQSQLTSQYRASTIDVNKKDNKPETYTGLNQILMSLVSEFYGYKSKVWGTYKTWEKMGYTPRGASPVGIVMPIMKFDAKTGKDIISRWKSTPGFNGDQVEPIVIRDVKVVAEYKDSDYMDMGNTKKDNLVNMTEECERLVSNFMHKQGIELKEKGSQAYYDPLADMICMPEKWRFQETVDGLSPTDMYTLVMLHEWGHATGRANRLDRGLELGAVDKESYAKEELIAEMCSIMIAYELGIVSQPQPNHLQYIKSWKKAIKDDSNYLTHCINQASAASKWFLENKTPRPMKEVLKKSFDKVLKHID